jgi:hypothetical protein
MRPRSFCRAYKKGPELAINWAPEPPAHQQEAEVIAVMKRTKGATLATT